VANFITALNPAILALANVSAEDVRRAGVFVICLVLAVGVHEFSHAWVAHRLGDRTPEGQGRLTLNPLAHYDLVGTILLPIVLAISSSGLLFGWGRPVETQPRHYTRKVTMRGGMALVSFAGPLSNLMLAILTFGVIAALSATGVITGRLEMFHPLRIFYSLNILLFVFNLIPVHPLDGGKILAWFMGPKYQHVDDFLQRYGFVILLVLIFMPPYLLGIILGPFFQWGNMALDLVM
jgi:Zn-dependent protease